MARSRTTPEPDRTDLAALVWTGDVDTELVETTARAERDVDLERGLVVQDLSGAIVAANAQAAALLGLTLDQLLGRTSMDPRWSAVSEIGHPIPGDAHPAMVTLSTGQPVEAFLMGVHIPQGTVEATGTGALNRWLLVDTTPLHGTGGLVGVMAAFSDATESRRGQSATGRLLESYRLLVENGSDVMATGTNAGTLDWVSPSVTDLLGWQPEQIVDRAFRDLVHPDDLPVVAATQEALLRGETGRFQVRLRTADDGFHWVSVLLKPVLDEAGNVVGRIAGWRDFESEHAKATALEESEARYRLLADYSTDVIALAGPDRLITWVSPSVTGLLGWSPAEMVGHLPTDFVHPDDLEIVGKARQVLVEGAPMRAEARVRKSNGSYRWVATAARPVIDDSGQVTALVATWRDIEAEHAERELRMDSEARYRLLAENASDVVYRIGTDGRVTWISPTVSRALGWQAEDLVGTSMYDLIHLEDRPRIDEAREAVLRGEDIDTPVGGWPSRFRRKDGTYTWMSLMTTVLHDESGRSTGAIVGMRNVDDLVEERREAEYEAARRQATWTPCSILTSCFRPSAVRRARSWTSSTRTPTMPRASTTRRRGRSWWARTCWTCFPGKPGPGC
jgi:PAS domain S-box-containing protein